MTEDFYQISIIISGKLLDFTTEETTYNKYNTGTGHLLVKSEQKAQIFPITAGKDLTKQLTELVGSYVEITGAVRNYRCNEEKYNVVRVYSATKLEEDTSVNSVQATCEVVGLMTKPGSHNKASIKTAQVYLLTNEKYDKHTRLNAVIFGTNDTPLSVAALPTLGTLYTFKGYLQLDKASQKPAQLTSREIGDAVEGKIELVITDLKQTKQNEKQ